MNTKLIKDFYSFMEKEMEGYQIYTDTPERRFEYDPESIWFINPKTKRWVLELEKSGKLWYYHQLYNNFLTSFKEEPPVFQQLIMMWVEDVLKRGVSATDGVGGHVAELVEDVLKRGVSTTGDRRGVVGERVEDILKRGVSRAEFVLGNQLYLRLNPNNVDDILENGISTNIKQSTMKNKENAPFRITIEHWDSKSSIEVNHSDITFQEYITLLKQVSLSAGFYPETVENFFNQEI